MPEFSNRVFALLAYQNTLFSNVTAPERFLFVFAQPLLLILMPVFDELGLLERLRDVTTVHA